MKILFQIVPALAGPVKNSSPIINPGNARTHDSWARLILNSIKSFPHTEEAVKQWVRYIDKRMTEHAGHKPRTAWAIVNKIRTAMQWGEAPNPQYIPLTDWEGPRKVPK